MKKSIIALIALTGVAAASEQVKSGSLTLDFTDIPKTVVDDATLFNYINGAVNEGGTLTFETVLSWNGNTTSDYQTILHVGEQGKGITLAVNGSNHLIFGENNDYSTGHELYDGTLKNGDNTVIFTLTGKNTPGTASASITLNGTTYSMSDMSWATMGWSEGSSRYDEYTLGAQGPGWEAHKKLVHITPSNMTVKYVAPVPEPATATLSLLALAGLAARRRRK